MLSSPLVFQNHILTYNHQYKRFHSRHCFDQNQEKLVQIINERNSRLKSFKNISLFNIEPIVCLVVLIENKTMKKYLFLFIAFTIFPKLWSSETLSLTYDMYQNVSNQSIIHIDAEIKSSGAEDVYFLSESCNGLDYYLGTSSTNAQILIPIHCNTTFPKKITIKANSSYTYEIVRKNR